MITKSIFKSKYADVKDNLLELNNFCEKIKQTLIHNYVSNSSTIMFQLFFQNSSIHNIQNSFYEKYNSQLVEATPFTDVRSSLLDSVLTLADTFKELFEIETLERIIMIVQEILDKLFVKILEYIPEIKSKVEKIEFGYNYMTQVILYI